MVQVTLHVLKPEGYLVNITAIAKKMAARKNVIYVSVDKPYKLMDTTFKKKGVKKDRVFFIDCISNQIGEQTPEVNNCVFLDGPQALTHLGLATTACANNIKGRKILILDSLSALLLYNDVRTIAKFGDFIINRMRDTGVDTILLALEDDMKRSIFQEIESLADNVVRR